MGGIIDAGAEREPSLLGTLEHISRLVVSHTGNPSETLTNIAHAIQQQFKSDVCSVYLLDADRRHLELAATIGLEPSSVGRVRMRMDEGLVGLTAEQLAPLVVADATRHPRFKYFPEAGEDLYHAFLGVPMLDRGLLVGSSWCRRSRRAPSRPTKCAWYRRRPVSSHRSSATRA